MAGPAAPLPRPAFVNLQLFVFYRYKSCTGTRETFTQLIGKEETPTNGERNQEKQKKKKKKAEDSTLQPQLQKAEVGMTLDEHAEHWHR